MKSISQQTPYGETIFCDDIRIETHGKISLMGLYQGTLIVYKPFPVTLTKLAMLISYNELPGESSSPVELRITIPGDEEDKPFFTQKLPIDDLRNTLPDTKISGEDVRQTVLSMVNITPFKVKEEGFIRVRAYRDDLEIRMGSLFVTSKPPESQPPVGSTEN